MNYASRFLIAKDASGNDYPAVAFEKDGVECIIDLQLMGLCTQYYPGGSTPVERILRLIDCEWAAAAETKKAA